MTDNEDRTLSDEVTKARDEVRRALAQIAAMAIEGTASDARIQEFAAQRLRILSAFDMLTAALDRVRDDAERIDPKLVLDAKNVLTWDRDAFDSFGADPLLAGHFRRFAKAIVQLDAARTQPEGQ